MPDTDTATQADLFMRVLRGVLRPLVRALITKGVTAPALYRLLKRVYVEVAESDFTLDGKRPTDSRITLLTGVHRRDVHAFRTAPGAEDEGARRKVTVIASVLGRWLADAAFNDATGHPKALPRTGPDTSFEALVASVSRDLRPRTVLDELVRQGLVEHDPTSDTLALRTDAFVGPEDLDQKVHFFAENVGDHIAAATDNLLADKPPFMERAVFYNNLTSASVDELETLARTLGGDALIDVNKQAHAHQQADAGAEDAIERFRFGVFFYREAEDNTAAGDHAEEPAENAPDGEKS